MQYLANGWKMFVETETCRPTLGEAGKSFKLCHVSRRLPTHMTFFPESTGSCLPSLQGALLIGCFHGDMDFIPQSSLLTSYKMEVCPKQNVTWGVTAIRIKPTTLFWMMLIMQPRVVHAQFINPSFGRYLP